MDIGPNESYQYHQQRPQQYFSQYPNDQYNNQPPPPSQPFIPQQHYPPVLSFNPQLNIFPPMPTLIPAESFQFNNSVPPFDAPTQTSYRPEPNRHPSRRRGPPNNQFRSFFNEWAEPNLSEVPTDRTASPDPWALSLDQPPDQITTTPMSDATKDRDLARGDRQQDDESEEEEVTDDPAEGKLPIYAKRSRILSTIKAHQVTIICGDTGSGKSTQVGLACVLGEEGRRESNLF